MLHRVKIQGVGVYLQCKMRLSKNETNSFYEETMQDALLRVAATIFPQSIPHLSFSGKKYSKIDEWLYNYNTLYLQPPGPAFSKEPCVALHRKTNCRPEAIIYGKDMLSALDTLCEFDLHKLIGKNYNLNA